MRRHAEALTAIVLFGGAFLSGCSSSANLVTADQIAKFTPGKTNETEIVAELGKPLHSVTEADGTKIEQYPSAVGASGGSMMPGFLGGSSATSYDMVSFTYGSGGVLKAVNGVGSPAASTK